ncbi:hypothetical protein MACJ_002265 [Theileria orientalis]|uniref:Uncharacterized protein n=1 Tax=Theileria orientalis TaxID=68886 RepID=A0A976M5Q8_THEOR|nr:hypothetical protein MACJ_002265 [Theileria orientalis]
MAYSQTSECSLKPSRFYEDLESASEGFFQKSCFVQKKMEEKIKNERRNSRNVYMAIRQLVSCCFGSKQGGSKTNIRIMGYDLDEMFDDVSTTVASSESTDTMIGYIRNESLWAIEPSKKYKTLSMTNSEAKWLLLSWASRIIRGENVNKNMLNSIIRECKVKSEGVANITKSVIKAFPGLNLSEDIYEMESSDLNVGLDNMFATLDSYVQEDKSTFVFMVHSEMLYAIYYTHQGSMDYIVLFEVKLFQKGEIKYFARFLAFESFDNVRDYMLSTRNIGKKSKLYFYFFNFKKLAVSWNDDVQQGQQEENKGNVEFFL